MAAPVLTWGSMGNMVKEQQEFADETQKYLEAYEIHDLFDHLLRQLVVHQPANPIKWLQTKLRSKPPLTVCIIGPPGSGSKVYAGRVADDFKAKHIKVGDLLRGRKELRATIDRGDLVKDDVVIEIVKQELASVSSKGSGWVLDGFPRTKVQAQALADKSCGFCHDKVILLQASDKVVRESYFKKLAKMGKEGEDMQDVIERKLQQYHRHIHGVVELFKSIMRTIPISGGDGASDVSATYETILQCLHMRPYSNAPLRPSRICVLGPCASGRTTQARSIATQFGLVHVDVAQLLRSQQQARGVVVEEVPPEYLSDEEICDLVGKRLNGIDCVRKGWVLDGFPKTASQAEFLRQSHLWPTRMVHLAIEEDEVQKRVALRRVDPVTGQAYYKSPNSVTVRQRLVQAEHDTRDNVAERYNMYKENVEKAIKAFTAVSFTVQAGGDVVDVQKAIHTNLTTPLASEITQDPEGTKYAA